MVDKSKLPSRHVSVGPKSAPHRAFYYAMGITEEQINQPKYRKTRINRYGIV